MSSHYLVQSLRRLRLGAYPDVPVVREEAYVKAIH
jgi:hypothetical protein